MYKLTIAQPGTMHEIVSNDGEYLCSLLGNNGEAEKQANAAFIVTACNSHAALVEALKMCEIALRYVNFDGEMDNAFAVPAAQKYAREALRMAKG